jgi:hypothetical protein
MRQVQNGAALVGVQKLGIDPAALHARHGTQPRTLHGAEAGGS